MSELKPCPFCGHEPMTFNQTGLIICAYAMCGVNPESKSEEDWNSRTTDRLVEENKELRAFLESLQLDVSNEIKLEHLLNKHEDKQC